MGIDPGMTPSRVEDGLILRSALGDSGSTARAPRLSCDPAAQWGRPAEVEMSQGEGQDAATYRVVVDHEKQYTVCPVERAIPRGWREAGKQGSVMECLAYIDQAWERLRAPADVA
ncbi:MbtH family protein [Sorangium sp. So ce861]|uniref:MbtH family protein n=1 Tax=Sorangium sp. So ce861 TaxID=3133323 RepID=UPI003F62A92B